MLEARAQLLETRDLRLGNHAGSELAQRGTQRQPTAWREDRQELGEQPRRPSWWFVPSSGALETRGTAHARRIEKCGDFLSRICAPGLAAVCRCASKIGMTPAGASPFMPIDRTSTSENVRHSVLWSICSRRVPRGACLAREESFELLFDVPISFLAVTD
jgi:hypothetical protein